MKKFNLIVAAACAVMAMQACKSNSKSGATDSTTTVTSDVTKTDSSKNVAAVDTGDAAFAAKAAAGGMNEIALSKAATQQASNAKVKDFASMMITDHTAAGDKLSVIAKAKGITLPTTPDTAHQAILADLSKKTGKDFDKAYVDQMVKDHQATVDMFKSAQSTVKDTSLKAFITNTLPVIQHHLEAIKTIKSGM